MKHNGMIVRSLITFFGLCLGLAYCGESDRENDQFHNQNRPVGSGVCGLCGCRLRSRYPGVPAGDLQIEAGNERRTTISQELADPLIGMIG
jgi:hypothetical protein